MTISATLDSYIHDKAGQYDTIAHSFTTTATEAALHSSVPLKQMVKAVVLHDKDRYMLAAIPSMNKLMLPQVQQLTGRHAELARENEISRIFDDCEVGAIPAIGQAFGLEVIWDDTLLDDADLYVEAGDHKNLIHLTREQFKSLMKNNPHGTISCAPDDLYDLTHY